MKELDPTDPIGQNLVKPISNVCFSIFVFSVLIFTLIAITYQPPDPWESSRALTKVFIEVKNSTFKMDSSVLKTGEDIGIALVASLKRSLAPITEDMPRSFDSVASCTNIATQLYKYMLEEPYIIWFNGAGNVNLDG